MKNSIAVTLLSIITTVSLAQNTEINVDMNVDGIPDMGVDMNINMSETHTTTTTTTTTTTHGGGFHDTHTTNDVYVMQGYNGPTGCNWPMDESQFSGVRQSVSSKDWDDTKLSMAKQIIGSNCLTAAQVSDLVRLMEWEKNKLDFAKFAYGYTFDIGNYYKVNDAFEWEASIEELNEYIQAFRW